MMPVAPPRRLPITTIVPGPAGGVSQACFLGRHAGLTDFITYDMGGTGTDVCLVRDAAPAMSTDGEIGTLPVKVPQSDIHTGRVRGGRLASLHLNGIRLAPTRRA